MMRPPKILLVGREDKTVAECEEPTRHAFLRRLYVFRAARALLFTFGLWALSQHPLEGKYQTYSSLLGISAYAVSSFVFTCASHVRRFNLVLLGIQEMLGLAAFSAVVADLVIDPLLMRCITALLCGASLLLLAATLGRTTRTKVVCYLLCLVITSSGVQCIIKPEGRFWVPGVPDCFLIAGTVLVEWMGVWAVAGPGVKQMDKVLERQVWDGTMFLRESWSYTAHPDGGGKGEHGEKWGDGYDDEERRSEV